MLNKAKLIDAIKDDGSNPQQADPHRSHLRRLRAAELLPPNSVSTNIQVFSFNKKNGAEGKNLYVAPSHKLMLKRIARRGDIYLSHLFEVVGKNIRMLFI